MANPISYDEIKPGASFDPSDFANPYFLPGGKYTSFEILEEGDDDFRVLYHGRQSYDDRIQVIEREQVYQMFGLEGIGDNPLGKTDVEMAMEEAVSEIGNEEEYLGEYAGTRIYARASLNLSKASIFNRAASAPIAVPHDGWEDVSGLRIKTENGEAVEVHAYAEVQSWPSTP